MTLLIDTNAVPAPHRVEFWAKSSWDAYHPLHIGTDGTDRFWARMWADRLGAIGVYRIAAGPNTMQRTPRDIVAGDPECLHIQIVLRGRLHGAQQHRATMVGPGDITSYDTSQPAIFRADAPFELLVMRLPKSALGKHAGKVSRLTALRIPGDAGLPRLAARFCCEAATGLADGSIGREDTGLAEHVVDLIRRLYVDLDATRPPRPRSTAELLIHAQAHVDARLGDPDLNPEELARACFISTRYLHRVFETAGLSVCDFIRSARLDRCRRDLIDPAFADQPISVIATRWGLPSAPHFSRLFRKAYGCSPRQFRQRGMRTGAVVDEAPEEGFSEPSRPPAWLPLDHGEPWTAAGWKPMARHDG
jgi:AraC-like DNA-binding protein